MRRKIFTYLIVFLLGMFVMPQDAYSFNMKMSTTSHKKITSKKAATKSCCDKKSSSKDKGCSKSCNDSKCQCSSLGSCTSLIFGITEGTTCYFFPSIERGNNFYYNAFFSNAFLTIWSLPKIS